MEVTLYIIKVKNYDIYKIGITENIVARLKRLQYNSPIPIGIFELYKNLNNPKHVESSLHKHFKDKNTHGEWFNLSKKDVKEIKGLIKNFDTRTIPQKKRVTANYGRTYEMSFKDMVEQYFEFLNSGVKLEKGVRKRSIICKRFGISDANLGKVLAVYNSKPELIEEMDKGKHTVNSAYDSLNLI